MEGSAGPDLLHGPPPLIPQDVLYEFRLVAFADSYVSDPSNIANISTSGENPVCGGEGGVVKVAGGYMGLLCSLILSLVLCPGLEVYPSRTQLPGLLPQPVLAGVVGGVCFLGVAVLVSILAACLMNRRRAARRHRKRLRQGGCHHSPPLGCSFSSTFITGVLKYS